MVGKVPGLSTVTYTNGHDEEVFVENDLNEDQVKKLQEDQHDVIVYLQLPPDEK